MKGALPCILAAKLASLPLFTPSIELREASNAALRKLWFNRTDTCVLAGKDQSFILKLGLAWTKTTERDTRDGTSSEITGRLISGLSNSHGPKLSRGALNPRLAL